MKVIRYALALLICTIIAPFIKADIPPEQTFGLYDAVEDPYKHLSPTHGFVASEQKTFDGYYHYLQKSEALYELMDKLFRFVDNITPHGSDRKLGYFLDAALIGKLLATIEKNLDQKTALITISKDALKNELIAILQAEEHLKKNVNAANRKNFAQVLVDALDETGHWDTKDKHYPQFLVHDMLLTLLFKKVNNKPEYKNYFDQFKNIKEINGGQGILKPNAPEILAKSYEDPSDPVTMAKNILAAQPTGDPNTMFDYVIKHYDAVAFATIKLGAQQVGYPPQVPYDKVLLSWYQKNPLVMQEKLNQVELLQSYGFSDCMETALRNLLIFTEYDQTNNSFKGTIKYFKKFDVKTITSETARIAWDDLVSDIPQAKYNKRVKLEKSPEGKNSLIMENAKDHHKNKPWIRPIENNHWYYYELEPGLDTIVFVINKIYNLELENFGAFLKHFNLECPSQQADRRETVCTITDQDKKNCILHYHPGHAYIQEYPRGKLVELISNFVGDIFPMQINSHFLPVLNLYRVNIQRIPLSESFRPFLKTSTLLRHAFLIQQLSSNDVKKSVLHFIRNELQEFKDDIWYRFFILQLINQLLSLNDRQLTHSIFMGLTGNAFVWNIFPEFIQKFKENKNLLSDFQIIDILKNLLKNFSETDKKIVSDFIIDQYNASNAYIKNKIMSLPLDPHLYKTLSDLHLSESK